MRIITLKSRYGQGTLQVVDDIVKGCIGNLWLVAEDGKLLPLFSTIELFKFPSPSSDGSRGATLIWALKGWNLPHMPDLELYELPDHHIDPII